MTDASEHVLGMTDVRRESRRLLAIIDYAGDPRSMSRIEWKEFLEELIEGLQSRLLAAQEELR